MNIIKVKIELSGILKLNIYIINNKKENDDKYHPILVIYLNKK
jgi:hypothetical protein